MTQHVAYSNTTFTSMYTYSMNVSVVDESLRFPVIGDWGASMKYPDRVKNQRETASAMNKWCEQVHCHFIVTTGDNFYPNGVTSPDDVRFNTSWRDVYTGSAVKNLTWYLSLGNHDYGYVGGSRDRHQVAYSRTREPRWWLPELYYTFTKKTEQFQVDFFVLHSNSLQMKTSNYSFQVKWLEEKLSLSSARWKIVIAHHPPYTSGGHGPGTAVMRQHVVPLLETYKADVMFLGHDHNLQHIRKHQVGQGVDYIISGGGGGAQLYSQFPQHVSILRRAGYSVRHFTGSHGFAGVEVNDKSIKIEFYDKMFNETYKYVRSTTTKPSSN